MGHVSLQRVVLHNFRAFEGKHVFDCAETGLWLIRGKNHDTRGDSAIGKSTLFLAIAYALDFCPYSKSDLQTWKTTDPMWVEIDLQTEEGVVTLHRGDKTWIKAGGSKVTSAKGVKEKLDKLLGVGEKLREPLTYRRQRKDGFFLSRIDSEKKKLLVELLSLQWLEAEIALAVKRVTTASKEFDQQTPLTERCLEDLRYFKEQRSAVGMFDETEIKQQIHLLKHKLQQATEIEVDTTKLDKLTGLLGQCEVRIRRIKAANQQATQTWNAQRITLQAQIDSERPRLASIEAAKRQIRNLQNEIADLEQSRCSMCKRQWDESSKLLLEKQAVVARLSEEVQTEPDILAHVQDLRRQIDVVPLELDNSVDRLTAAQESIQKEISEENYKIRHEKDLAVHQAQLELSSAESALAMTEMHNRSVIATKEAEEKAIARAQKAYDEVLALSAEKQTTLNQERDYLAMLRGFLGKIFEEVLIEIAAEANKIIGAIPNTAHVTLSFQTERETQDGNIRNEITPVVSFGDIVADLDAGASGGMYTSIELAVDLAVGRVISRRTGCDLGWLILDESFDGHGPVEKEACLEVLKEYAKDKLIMIVDHASEFKEMFSRVVNVNYHNGRAILETE